MAILTLKLKEKHLKIPIERVHLEEDTAKMTHSENNTLIDYNRAGIPLIEIVTKPQLHTSQQVVVLSGSLTIDFDIYRCQ